MFLARTLTTFLVLSFTFNPSALSANSQPLIVGHRGVSLDAPENTLSNFRACLALRIGFEFDVRRSKDGVLVCIHDANVRRTTNGAGKVAELTFAKIRKLDAGSWYDRRFAGEKVPSIEEILQIIAADSQFDVLIAVDIKVDGVATKVVELAETYGVLDKLL